MKKRIASFLPLVVVISSFANVRLPCVIGSHMVLQQNSTVTIWGWCDPSEKIELKAGWDTTNYKAVGDWGARWSIQLKTPAAGGPYQIAIKGNNEITLDDVLVGEVWVCSGQSNMEMNVGWGLPYDDEVAKASNKEIRFFYVPKTTAVYPQDDIKGAQWVVCSPEEMKRFSAAGYFFGKKINETLHVPVGLINSNWGGTPAETWTPENLLNQDSSLKKAAARLKQTDWWPIKAGAAFNAMIAPLTPYNIAGAIWYQGETNVGALTYHALFSDMIEGWRQAWKIDFPFYFVQIAPYAGYGDNSSAAFLREQQTQTLDVPNTGMVLTSDLVDNIKDIHPKLKKEVGERLANVALAQTYHHEAGAWKIPMYASMKVEKNRIRISFTNAENGLKSNGPLKEFYIAGADKNFIPANAKIEGNTLVVWSKDVPEPVAVRFGFRNAAMLNLYNKEGVPVNLFRTDDWPVDIVTGEK